MTRQNVHRGVLLITVLATACVSAGRLGEFDFRDRSVGVATTTPPRPQVFTSDFLTPGSEGWFNELLRIGTGIAKEIEADEAREKLQEAVNSVDVAGLMADRVLEVGARLLRARPVESVRDADFELEILIEDYGIEADSWDSQANFFVKSDVFLYDVLSGDLIWETGVEESDPINPGSWGGSEAMGNVITARALGSLSVEDMELALGSLAVYAADRMTERLREALQKAREDRRG